MTTTTSTRTEGVSEAASETPRRGPGRPRLWTLDQERFFGTLCPATTTRRGLQMQVAAFDAMNRLRELLGVPLNAVPPAPFDYLIGAKKCRMSLLAELNHVDDGELVEVALMLSEHRVPVKRAIQVLRGDRLRRAKEAP